VPVSPLDALKPLAETAPEQRADAFTRACAAATSLDRELRAASADPISATGTPREAIEWLGRLASDPDVGVRYSAVAATAGLVWKARFTILRKAMEDEDLGIVALAADGLSYAGDHRAAPRLRSLVSEKRLQFGALEGLYNLRDTEVVPIARKLFNALLTPLFEKTMVALILAREGDEAARAYLRKRITKRFTEERGLVVKHLIEVDPVEGQATVERIAGLPKDDQRETALLALTRLDAGRWWDLTAETIVEALSVEDYEGAAEVLLSLADIDQRRTMSIALKHLPRTDALGEAARRLRLAASLREAFPNEVQLRCA
jgi:HEAT repeat protein